MLRNFSEADLSSTSLKAFFKTQTNLKMTSWDLFYFIFLKWFIHSDISHLLSLVSLLKSALGSKTELQN